jgi:hypothetical protein
VTCGRAERRHHLDPGRLECRASERSDSRPLDQSRLAERVDFTSVTRDEAGEPVPGGLVVDVCLPRIRGVTGLVLVRSSCETALPPVPPHQTRWALSSPSAVLLSQ